MNYIVTPTQYSQALEKGQVLPLENLPSITIPVSLIHKGHILQLKISRKVYQINLEKNELNFFKKVSNHLTYLERPGHSEYSITLNETEINLEIVRLSDGGILVQLNGSSFCSYLQETMQNYRVTVNNQTAIFDKENDPSVLQAPSAGKLITYLVGDGDDIAAGTAYAELEVMKMVMQVKVSLSGKLVHQKKPGALVTQGQFI